MKVSTGFEREMHWMTEEILLILANVCTEFGEARRRGADSELLPLGVEGMGARREQYCSYRSGWRRGCVLLKDQVFCLSVTLQRRGQRKKCPDVLFLLTPDLSPVPLIG